MSWSIDMQKRAVGCVHTFPPSPDSATMMVLVCDRGPSEALDMAHN